MLTSRTRSYRSRFGFTLIETLIALAFIAILGGVAAPLVTRQMTHARVNNAAQVIAGDLEMALALAGRQRRPVRVTIDPSQRAVLVIDRASGQTLTRRVYGSVTEYKLQTLTASPASIDIMPHGVTTAATTLTVGIGSYSRRITLTRAGRVRVQPL
jgi:type IV fimbrial biogenesis protein FimT